MFSPPKRVEFMERRPLGLACGTGANGCRLDHLLCEHPVDERSLAPERFFPQRQNPIFFAGPEKACPSLPAFSFVLSGGGPRLYLITGPRWDTQSHRSVTDNRPKSAADCCAIPAL